MISMSATMDTSGFQRSLMALVEIKNDAPGIVKRVAGAVVKDCVKLTPPFGKSPSSEKFEDQKKVGFQAVENDVRKVFHDIKDLQIVKERTKGSVGWNLRKAALRGDGTSVLEILKDIKIDATSFDSSPTAEHHLAVRDNRGRTNSKRGSFWVAGGIAAFTKSIQKHVGKAKHGWSTAIRTLGVKGVPNWVINNDGPSGECLVEGAGTLKFSVTFENTVPYIQRAGRDLGIVSAAFKSTSVRLDREVEKILAYRFKKAKATH